MWSKAFACIRYTAGDGCLSGRFSFDMMNFNTEMIRLDFFGRMLEA